MPFADATFTMTVLPLAAESVTVNDAVVEPELPSVTATSLMDKDGSASSSVIVMTPCASEIVAFDSPERFTVNLSSSSSVVSPRMPTETVFDVSPGEKVSVVDRDV